MHADLHPYGPKNFAYIAVQSEMAALPVQSQKRVTRSID